MSENGGFAHTPVLLKECMEQLGIKENGIYMDGTLGGGGHSFEICTRLKSGHLYGIDQDAEAIEAAGERLRIFEGRVTLVHSNFREFRNVMENFRIEAFDGILLDLGVSSYQLDNAERGFSYREDAPLDMRMDGSREQTARDIVNGYSEAELYRVIRDFGEERFAKNIAKHIVLRRAEKPFETTYELNDVIRASIPAKCRTGGGHPSKRTFQAIRIELNRELAVLEESLAGMIRALAPGGRLCVITFHSLEDRIVKKIMKESESPCICPSSFPVCVCGRKSLGNVITKKPILPSDGECEENPRAKSAKLRVFERSH